MTSSPGRSNAPWGVALSPRWRRPARAECREWSGLGGLQCRIAPARWHAVTDGSAGRQAIERGPMADIGPRSVCRASSHRAA
jgi:hypothetical protein